MTTTAHKLVLVAEDDKFLSSIYQKHLALPNVEVVVVGNGQQVVDFLKERIPDLLVLDIIMPVMNGFEVLKYLKEHEDYKDLKIVVASNLGHDDEKKEALQLGADDYVIKSNVSFSEIIDKIKTYL